MKKILVTGHYGFIGSHLVKRLRSLGHEVDGLSLENGDIRDAINVSKAVKGKDVVFHLAAVNRIEETEGDPSLSLSTNVNGTVNIIMACRRYDSKLIFTSSSCIYGETGKNPIAEDGFVSPRGWYSSHKLMAEGNCNIFSDFIVRPASVYGESPLAHCVLNKFVRQMKKGEDIRMYNNEKATRDYVYVDDVVDALLLGFDNVGIYNVGSGTNTSIIDLLNLISKTLDVEYKTEDMGTNLTAEQSVEHVMLDLNKIHGLGWNAKVGLEEGVRRVCEGD